MYPSSAFCRRILLGFLGWVLHFSSGGIAFAQNNSEHRMPAEALEERAKRLRAALCSRVQESRGAGTIVTPQGVDAEDVVREYIPIGTSFDEAEQILRLAGFKVFPRPTGTSSNERPDKHDVTAFLDSPMRGMPTLQVVVALGPELPGRYTSVARISAGLFIASL